MRRVRAEVVCDGIRFGEGPVWCPDGTLVVTSVADGALYRIDPGAGTALRWVDTGGGANGAALGADGSFLVTQNGGIDFAAYGLYRDDPPPYRPVTPSLQRVGPDEAVSVVAAEGFRAPNDLAVHPDGRVVFTDPGHFPPADPPVARLMELAADGSTRVVADGFTYCNGVALEPDGTVVVVEAQGLQRVHADGPRSWWIEVLGPGGGDGFCVDVDGRAYVASTTEHGVRVVDPDGAVVDFLEIAGAGLTTNCCFGGDDGRTLFATDALPGHVVAWEGMPTPGLPLPSWPGVRGA